MGIGIVTITKQAEGQEWTNVHGFSTSASALDQPLAVADLEAIGVLDIIDETTTDAAPEVGSLAGINFIHSLVAWERLILDDDVNIVRVYVSDGLDPLPGEDSVFFTADTNLPGLASIAALSSLSVGPIVLQINKQPAVLSRRVGRGFFRTALADTEIAFGGERLVTWRTSVQEENVKTRISEANSLSALSSYFGVDGQAGVLYGIPSYQGRCEPSPGALKRIIPISNLIATKPTVRSVTRRKRNTPAACPT